MGDSTALATTPDKRPQIAMSEAGIQLRNFDEMARFSLAIVNSGLAPKSYNSPEAVMVAIQAGLEIGLPPMQALQGIAVINGRPTLWGDAALAVVQGHPDFEDIEEVVEGDGDAMAARCTIHRRHRIPVSRTFSVADAKKAGLWGKAGPWQQYPARMLQMRARGFAMRDSFADALKGCGIREEVQDYREPKRAQAREVEREPGLEIPQEEPTE